MWGICVTLLCSNTGSGETPGVNEMRSLAVLTLTEKWQKLLLTSSLRACPTMYSYTSAFFTLYSPISPHPYTKNTYHQASYINGFFSIVSHHKYLSIQSSMSEIMGREDDLSAVCFANVPGVWSLHHPLSALFYSSCSKSPAMQTYKATFFFFFTKTLFVINLKVYF